MKTLGMIGGMSWESTATYYRLLNEGVKRRCGGFHSAKILMYSVDFAEIEAMQTAGAWHDMGTLLSQAAVRLETAGADVMMICTNTMHKVADQVQECISVPLLHIADATAEKVKEDGITTVGLLGTAFTMEQDFYRRRLERTYGLEVLIPQKDDRRTVHDIIYQELCQGQLRPESRTIYRDIVAGLGDRGAEAVILGCTEISLLLRPDDTRLSLYDTTALHADRAVTFITG